MRLGKSKFALYDIVLGVVGISVALVLIIVMFGGVFGLFYTEKEETTCNCPENLKKQMAKDINECLKASTGNDDYKSHRAYLESCEETMKKVYCK